MKGKTISAVFSRTTFSIVVVSFSLAGCAVGPNADLQRARASLMQAQQDPQVVTYAPAQLRDAEQTLNRAEQTWNDEGDRAETAHLSYVAEQQANIAVAKAQEGVAEAEARRLAEERDQIRLQARAREAELAQNRAQIATTQALEATARAHQLEQELAELHAQETERGLLMTLPDNVLFEYNKAELKPGAMRNLYPLVTFLRDYPDRTLLIEGHTDSLGSDAYNLELSRSRALAVENFLVLNGISRDRIVTRGYGKDYPVASNTTEAGRQQNRRVDVIVSHPGQHIAER
jgi:outer membrane protein OmpA-like peptidoglycan-associated protein